jgi:hypothetical protein
MLRLADSLDRTHQQRVRSVEARSGPDGVTLYLESPENTDLEIWAAQQVSDAFRQTFKRTLTLLPKNH